MSVAASWMAAAAGERLRLELARAAFRVRLVKLLCFVALAVCFWYSVPYVLPFVPEHSIDRAGYAAAVAETGNLSRQIAVPIVGAISMFLLWRLPRRGRIGGRLVYFAAAYIVWAFASIGWSESPGLSLKRLVVFGFNCFFAYAIARVLSMTEMATLGAMATGTVALIAVYADVVMQRIFSPSDPEYRFQGVTTANYQAMSLCVGLFCVGTLVDRKPGWTKRLLAALGVLLVLLVMTRSRASTLIAVALLAVMAVRLLRLRTQPATRAMLLLAGLAVVLPALAYTVFSKGSGAAQAVFMMGRNDTQNTANLSNRGPLWQELGTSVAEKPVFGFGYDAFWNSTRVARISADQGWAVPHAHNTYLDQMLSLGVVGALLYAGVLWSACGMAWARYRRGRDASALFAAVLLTWLVIEGLSESAPVDPYLPTLLAYACVAKMCLMESSEDAADRFTAPDVLLVGVTPMEVERLPAGERAAAMKLLEGSKA